MMTFRVAILSIVAAVFLPASISQTFVNKDVALPHVPGHPFAAVAEASETRDTQAVTEYQEKLYRDSEGRTRVEIFGPTRRGVAPQTPTSVIIIDPIAELKFTLFPAFQIALREALHSPIPVLTEQKEISDNVSEYVARQRPSQTSEDLGTQTIGEFLAKCERITLRESVASTKTGQPKVMEIEETWVSTNYDVPVLTKQVDRDGTETISRIVSFYPTEPDSELFRVPPQYTVQ